MSCGAWRFPRSPAARRTFALPSAPKGRFEGLTIDHLEMFTAEDRFWARFQTDDDAEAFGSQWAAFARAALFPTLTAALDGGVSDPTRAVEFVEQFEAAVADVCRAPPNRCGFRWPRWCWSSANDCPDESFDTTLQRVTRWGGSETATVRGRRMSVQDDKVAGQEDDQQAQAKTRIRGPEADGQQLTEKPEPDDDEKGKAAEMMTAYEDRPTLVLPGTGGRSRARRSTTGWTRTATRNANSPTRPATAPKPRPKKPETTKTRATIERGQGLNEELKKAAAEENKGEEAPRAPLFSSNADPAKTSGIGQRFQDGQGWRNRRDQRERWAPLIPGTGGSVGSPGIAGAPGSSVRLGGGAGRNRPLEPRAARSPSADRWRRGGVVPGFAG